MRKFISMILMLILSISILTACGGGEEITLAEVTTDQGVTLELPNDMEKKSEILYADASGNAAVFQVMEYSEEEPISDWFEEAVAALIEQTYTDVEVTNFENDNTINGNTGMVAYFTAKTTDGEDRGGAMVMLTDGTNNYIVNFVYRGENAEGFFATNLESITNSITTN